MATKRVLAIVAALAATVSIAGAQEEPAAKVSAKGRVAGGNKLLNPVWNEAKDPKNHRYTFRMPSTTVGKGAKTLTAYLPKEVAIVALAEGAVSGGGTTTVNVSGGRTTPVTIVVSEGANVQFVNHDPFPHKLYSVNKDKGSMGPEETKKDAQRTWQPPAVGVYEIRDAYFPSVRSWVVVEPKVAGVGHPNLKNEFIVPDLTPGLYTFQAYFNGEKVGEPLQFELRPRPELQPIPKPLVLAKGKKKDADKKDEKEEKKE